MTQGPLLRCAVFTLTLVTTQCNTRINSDLILAFLCVTFLHLVMKSHESFNTFALRKLDTTQRMHPCITLRTSLKICKIYIRIQTAKIPSKIFYVVIIIELDIKNGDHQSRSLIQGLIGGGMAGAVQTAPLFVTEVN